MSVDFPKINVHQLSVIHITWLHFLTFAEFSEFAERTLKLNAEVPT